MNITEAALRDALKHHHCLITLDRSVVPENIIASCSCGKWTDDDTEWCVADAHRAWDEHFVEIFFPVNRCAEWDQCYRPTVTKVAGKYYCALHNPWHNGGADDPCVFCRSRP